MVFLWKVGWWEVFFQAFLNCHRCWKRLWALLMNAVVTSLHAPDGLPGTECCCSVPQQHYRWLLVPDVCQSITMSIIVSTFQLSLWTAPHLSSTDSPVSWMSSFEAELKSIRRILAKVFSSLGETVGSGVWRPLWITWSSIQAQLNYETQKFPS